MWFQGYWYFLTFANRIELVPRSPSAITVTAGKIMFILPGFVAALWPKYWPHAASAATAIGVVVNLVLAQHVRNGLAVTRRYERQRRVLAAEMQRTASGAAISSIGVLAVGMVLVIARGAGADVIALRLEIISAAAVVGSAGLWVLANGKSKRFDELLRLFRLDAALRRAPVALDT